LVGECDRQGLLQQAGCMHWRTTSPVWQRITRVRRLAEAVNAMDGFTVDLDSVQTNMVYIDGELGALQILAGLAEHGVDVLDVGPTAVRAVIHLHITDEDIDRTIAAFAAL